MPTLAKDSGSYEPCPECAVPVPHERRTCISCEHVIGFPNVRHASREIQELEARYQSVLEIAKAQQKIAVLERFEDAMSRTQAIMIRSVIDTVSLISSNSKMYMTFEKQMRGDGRVAENNEWDRARISVEPMIHPHFHSEIHYACLSLTDLGANDSSYGACHLTLKEAAIKARTTVFEENSIDFVRRHKIIAGDPIPCGHRASWEQRQKLAVCKLSPKLNSNTEPTEFDQLLKGGSGKDADFIEAHIYGAMHSSVVEKITVVAKDCSVADLLMLEAQGNSNNLPINRV